MAERTKVSARADPQRTPTSANVPAIVQNDFDFMIATPLTRPPPPAQVSTAISVCAFEEDVCLGRHHLPPSPLEDSRQMTGECLLTLRHKLITSIWIVVLGPVP